MDRRTNHEALGERRAEWLWEGRGLRYGWPSSWGFPVTWSTAILAHENAVCGASLLVLLAWRALWPLPSRREVVEGTLGVPFVIRKESFLKRGDEEGFPGSRQQSGLHVLLGLPGRSGQQLLSRLCTSFCGL